MLCLGASEVNQALCKSEQPVRASPGYNHHCMDTNTLLIILILILLFGGGGFFYRGRRR